MQFERCCNPLSFELLGQLAAHAPNLTNRRDVHQLHLSLRVGQVNNATGSLELLGGIVCQLRKCLGWTDADTHRDTNMPNDSRTNFMAVLFKGTYAGQIQEGFIDGVDFDMRAELFQRLHDP